MKYIISKLALEDIDSIWEYTVQEWSIKQAEKYYNTIISKIQLICQNPKIGESIKDVKDTHRKQNIGSHMIIYKFQDDLIFIDRILHQRMDIENQLGDYIE